MRCSQGTQRRARQTTLASTGRVMAVVGVLVATLAGSADGESWRGLGVLPRVALEISLEHGHPELSAAQLARRAADALADVEPRLTLDPAALERLRLTVSVRPYSATALRGFYLPFSGTYGIGSVTLGVERPAQIPGIGGTVPAVVWQAERQAAGPWRRSAAEVLTLVDELVGAFLADYRQAAP